MKRHIYKSFFGLGAGPGVAPTSPGSKTKVGGKSKVDNLYYELTPYESQPTPPYNNGNDVFGDLSSDFEPSPWLSAGDKASLIAADLMVENPSYGYIALKTISAGTQGFYYVGDGIYIPNQDDAGNITNTVDWSDKYDAVRGFCWFRYVDAGASAGVIPCGLAQRPTTGTSSFGGLSIDVYRSFNHTLSIGYDNGDGGSGRAYMGTQTALQNDTTCVQWEFVKGSHCKLEMYYNTGALDFSPCSDPPDWNFDTPANVATVDLSGSGYNQLVPVNPSFFAQLSAAGHPGYWGKWAWECRPIGGKWKTLK